MGSNTHDTKEMRVRTTRSRRRSPGSRAVPRPGVLLASVMLGVLVVAMSISGTAVAVPNIGADLEASGAALHWVVAGYNLTFAAFTLVCGSLADLFGRRLLFAVGAVVFLAGNLASALAGDILLLDAARLLTGVGGAAIMASGGALLAMGFDGAARTRAFAAMGTMAGVGIAIGPTLSGLLVGAVGWRTAFLVYAAVGLLILVGSAFVAESRASERPRVDWVGSVTFVVSLTLVMYAVIEAPEAGWGTPAVVGALAAGAVLLALFFVVESRVARPVLDLSLVRDGRFMAWCLATLTTSIGFLGVLVFLPTYLQGVQGVSAQTAGLMMLMLTAPVLVAPSLGGWMVAGGVSARGTIVVALLLVAGGNALLTVLHPQITALGLALPLVLIGTGMGLSFGITDGQAMGVIEPGKAGMAAGFLNTLRGGAEALVIAVFGAALTSIVAARTGSSEAAARATAGDVGGSDALAGHLTAAWDATSWGVAALSLVATAGVFVLLARRRSAVEGVPGSDRTEAEPAGPEPVER
ncbi:Spectinomycin tetracycline efflux pump [Nocardiopsis dassonvillei]|uniref:Major facilitator superfamily MFS_1 n=2 Tax=Nocardiopsis dassonvillei TaxID=2014 RepID=D7AVP8_NOCDD|nr:major facilitator superfamily MFS_1 [Nocardiopsis dassonvillei subsp. dassonvillei DSM 43111]VEI88175.1 Spectinomycin tetracycline efflux pump [Nocardiopsis dassonvillei]